MIKKKTALILIIILSSCSSNIKQVSLSMILFGKESFENKIDYVEYIVRDEIYSSDFYKSCSLKETSISDFVNQLNCNNLKKEAHKSYIEGSIKRTISIDYDYKNYTLESYLENGTRHIIYGEDTFLVTDSNSIFDDNYYKTDYYSTNHCFEHDFLYCKELMTISKQDYAFDKLDFVFDSSIKNYLFSNNVFFRSSDNLGFEIYVQDNGCFLSPLFNCPFRIINDFSLEPFLNVINKEESYYSINIVFGLEKYSFKYAEYDEVSLTIILNYLSPYLDIRQIDYIRSNLPNSLVKIDNDSYKINNDINFVIE